MGNRIAEFKELGSETTQWVVFQSTTQFCFGPIFGSHLAAELFAQTLMTIYPNWADPAQEELASRVNAYITATFGEEPEDHPDYDEYLSDVEKFAALRGQFIAGWPAYKNMFR